MSKECNRHGQPCLSPLSNPNTDGGECIGGHVGDMWLRLWWMKHAQTHMCVWNQCWRPLRAVDHFDWSIHENIPSGAVLCLHGQKIATVWSPAALRIWCLGTCLNMHRAGGSLCATSVTHQHMPQPKICKWISTRVHAQCVRAAARPGSPCVASVSLVPDAAVCKACLNGDLPTCPRFMPRVSELDSLAPH